MRSFLNQPNKYRQSWRYRIADICCWTLSLVIVLWAFIPGLGPDLAGFEDKGVPSVTTVNHWWQQRRLNNAASTEFIQTLKSLPTAKPSSITKYKRTRFGQPWADIDHNGCDTRNDILRRDLQDTTVKPGTGGCKIMSGTLFDPYTAKTINFKQGRETSMAVHIEHVVALANAWEAGADKWNSSKRLAFANDPLNLLAIDGPINVEKGKQTIDQWLPPNEDFLCTYAALQVAIKKKYGLSITPAEYSTLVDYALSCPNEPLPH